MSAHDSTRRTVIAGAATVPLAIALNVASPDTASADQTIATLAAQLEAALDRLDQACAMLGGAEQAMFEWSARNPQPIPPKASDEAINGWAEQIEYILRDNPHPLSKAAIDEHGRALSRWEQRKRAAEAQYSYDEAKSAEQAANDEVDRLSQTLADTPARSLRALSAKAQLADMMADDDLARAVVQDILALS